MEDFEEDNLLVQDEENAFDDEDGYIFADDMKNIQLTHMIAQDQHHLQHILLHQDYSM